MILPFQQPASEADPPARPIRLIREAEVRNRLGGLAGSTFRKMIRDGRIPAPLHFEGGRASFWLESEIDDTIESLRRKERE